MDEAMAELKVTTTAGKGGRLILTRTRVYGELDRGVFGTDLTSIPLQAVDSLFNGWRRAPMLLYIGGTMALFSLAMVATSRSGQDIGVPGLMTALIFLLAFWFYKPKEIRIQSGNESIGGVPASHEEGQRFALRVMEEIEASRSR